MKEILLDFTAIKIDDVIYEVGDLVNFRSDFQNGTAFIEKMTTSGVVLRGEMVWSRWEQPMEPGNCIMGSYDLIKGKAL